MYYTDNTIGISNDSVIMCLPKRNAEVYSQRFFGSNDELMFCKREKKKDYENQTKTMKRCNLKRCYFGSLNVRTLRIKRTINSGKLQCINEHKNGTLQRNDGNIWIVRFGNE